MSGGGGGAWEIKGGALYHFEMEPWREDIRFDDLPTNIFMVLFIYLSICS